MIILSGVLVVLAIALLVTGIVTGNTGHEVAGLDGLKLIYVSIGVSIISALCLAIGVFLRRKELFGGAEAESSAKRSAARAKAARTTRTKARVGAGEETPVTVAPTTAIDVPAETSVYVVPGRKRYHLETCRQLAGRDKEELTYVEAREEGFTPCTACLPDTALAARAAVTETEPAAETPASTEDARTTESLEPMTETSELTRPRADDPAPVTRTDLPVTRLDDDEIEPAAESPSPAAAELPETSTPAVPADSVPADHEADVPADAEAHEEPVEAPAESDDERPQARSRSFFEPIERHETSTADDKTPSPADEDDLSSTDDLSSADGLSSTDDLSSTDSESPEKPSEPEAAEPADEPSEPEPADDEVTSEPEPSSEETDEEPTAEAPVEAPADKAEAQESDEADKVEETDEEPAEEAVAADDSTAEEETAEASEPEEPATEEPAAGEPSDTETVRILSGTKRYHRSDCALIEDIADDADDLETLTRAEAKERGCTPCLVCQPDKDPSDDSF